MTDPSSPSAQLDQYYDDIKTVILSRQHPVTGLLPASTAVNTHGDYRDAWVRDNVYSILAVWGLALAYRKLDDHSGRTYELEHAVVKLMRGLLFAMMRQASKVETFKVTQHLLDALHAKYDTATADVVVDDDKWGHLQLDATSLFLLMLAQMTASGLQIIFTLDEVNFVQNLTYYIGRAYRTPDYGIWERGNKINHGDPELNASSIGIAKAALEALNRLNLFGIWGGQSSVLHILPDEIARTRITLNSILPRESGSKEVDGALLSVIGFPAFAVEDLALVKRTRENVITKLEGRYGCKRFLRDGHQTVIEDSNRLHYEPFELKQFEHIECEWPLFFTYLLLDALFRGDRPEAERYWQKLEQVLVARDGRRLLPELYYVPEEHLEAERAQPQSQPRLPNENVPLVWAQSLYYLGGMLLDGLLDVGDIDPLGRHLRANASVRQQPLVQIALLAENETLQTILSNYGIATQVPWQVEPIQVRRASELAAVYMQIGRNDALGLTGRPPRRLRSLTTARIFRIGGTLMVFLPSFLDPQQFYLTLDYHFLVAQIQSELAYIYRHWRDLGRPTVTLLLTRAMVEAGSEEGLDQSPLLNLVKQLRDGYCGGTPVRLGTLQQLIITAGSERMDEVHDFEFTEAPVQSAACPARRLNFDRAQMVPLSGTEELLLEQETDLSRLRDRLRQSSNLYEQTEILETLAELRGVEFDTGFGGPGLAVTVADLLEEVYTRAGEEQVWSIVRRAAGLLNKVDMGLTDAVTEILVQQKQITVGKAFSAASIIDRPMPYTDILAKIHEFCGEDARDRALTQEILVYLSLLIKTEPELFKGFLTLRVSYLILLLTSELALERHVTQDAAYEALMELSPFDIKMRLRQVLAGYDSLNQTLLKQESLSLRQASQPMEWIANSADSPLEPTAGNWLRQRQLDGALNRVPPNFYPRVWQVLQHCQGVVIGDKLERRNRLESELILAEMTPGEKNFALRVEYLLNKIQAPEYRQANIEALMTLANLSDRNPDFQIEGYIVLDVLIGHAVRLAWLGTHPDRTQHYDEDKSKAWRAFYGMSAHDCSHFVAEALRFLIEMHDQADLITPVAPDLGGGAIAS
jgi:phosphorylase kinase alpha/beta subunit